jgi:DNA-binding transcriptional ArsR family regulator
VPSGPEIRIINDPDTLRLIADPLRLRLLELLRRQPRTVTELAALLELPRTNLYYHVRLLEQHGLVEVTETRLVSGIAEKHYRAAAFRLSVDKTLFGTTAGSGSPLEVYLAFIFDEVATEIGRAVEAGLIELDQTHEDVIMPHRLVIGRKWYRLTDDDVAEFDRRLDAVGDAFAGKVAFEDGKAAGQDEPGTRLYEFLTGFYPIVPPGEESNARD